MRLSHTTDMDLELEHQVIMSHGDSRGQNISCNCRLEPGTHEKAGKLFAKPMGQAKNLEESRKLYNNPDNHYAPFGENDRAKW